eukprot:TRINITY_DN40197_c0_g1_i8.p1 TRINITY_DN40197_c0_g1~~TRINITY_DN40197_c0_g1_i8.p1  ORF type:complete len:238 (-),score=44.82 TRINITY_DN40197_c0_g1_i8:430-1104(-)
MPKTSGASKENSKSHGEAAKSKGKKRPSQSSLAEISNNVVVMKKPKACVEDCKPGPKNDCWQRSGVRKEGYFSCVEVHALLKDMGIEEPEGTSRCIRAAIMRGHIKVTGKKEDLDMIIWKGQGICCDDEYRATLGQLLQQQVYYDGDDPYDSPISCVLGEECTGDLGKILVANLCSGTPRPNMGKGQNHCYDCSAFGKCLPDFRDSHYNEDGNHTNKIHFVSRY